MTSFVWYPFLKNKIFLQEHCVNEPDFIKMVNDVMKLQTGIHAKVDMSDSQWDELQMEEYQNIELAEDIDARTYLDCMLVSNRGACIKYGEAKKREVKAKHEFLERKIAATNRLINLRAVPETDFLEKLETYMDLKNEMDEKSSKETVQKHRAKVLLEGERPTKYFCSLQKVVEKYTGIIELHIEHEQENSPPLIESIKDQSKIE